VDQQRERPGWDETRDAWLATPARNGEWRL
jgi:hypothetical protein